MSERLIVRFISEVKNTSTQHAEDAMIYPKVEAFERGLQVGKYQGLQHALQILESIMCADQEKESNS